MTPAAGARITLTLAILGLAGCAGPSARAPVGVRGDGVPETYVVVRGDTLHAIAWRHGLDYREIAAWNGIPNPDLIYAGQRLRLVRPAADAGSAGGGARGSAAASRARARPSRAPAAAHRPAARAHAEAAPPPVIKAPSWRWPTDGNVVGGFDPGQPGGKGVQIGGRLGQPVHAASAGEVVYSGSGLPGYGRLIILKHSDTLLSAYGYLSRMLVGEGDNIKAGQSIGEMGLSHENRPVLHFEIRQNGRPVDPLRFLQG